MSQGFKLKYDELREGDPTRTIPQEASYGSEGYVRNICFVLPDGNRMFLNYAYLVSGEYLPEQSRIVLSWTTHVVSLAGIHLEPLFYELMQYIPRQIICQDERYNAAAEKNKSIVNEMTIQKL